MGALALPLALITVGVSEHVPAHHAGGPAPKVMEVTRVVRVVKPVRVQRVVKIRTVAQQVPTAAPVYRTPATSVSKPARKHVSRPKRQSAPKTQAPKAQVNTPKRQQTAPTTTTPTPTTQNQTSLPSADQSGAAASPTS
jgi:hypothetical protein